MAHVFLASSEGMARNLGTLLGNLNTPRDFGIRDYTRPSEVRFEQWLALFLCFKVMAGKKSRDQPAGAEGRV